MTKKSGEAIAFHEAGHAVMACQESVGFKGVTIIPNEYSRGRFIYTSPLDRNKLSFGPSKRDRWRMESEVQVCLAGAVAQRLFKPRSWRHHHGEPDLDAARELLFYFCISPKEMEAYLHLLQIRTEQRLQRPNTRKAVEAVARALLELGKINSREVGQIVLESFPMYLSPEVLKSIEDQVKKQREDKVRR